MKPPPASPPTSVVHHTEGRHCCSTAAAVQETQPLHSASCLKPCATKTTNQGENPTHAAEKTDEIPAHARHKPCSVLKLYISCSAATAAADCTIHLGPTACAATATASPHHDLTSCRAIQAIHDRRKPEAATQWVEQTQYSRPPAAQTIYNGQACFSHGSLAVCTETQSSKGR